MEKMEILSEDELQKVVHEVLTKLQTTKKKGAKVLALHGDLGAGKTAFVKALGEVLGVKETITSPTFVILKIYPLDENHDFESLAHIDAYRIETLDEMRPLRFAELLEEEKTLVCIEWAEKIAPLLPAHTVHLTLTIKGEGREITIS